MTTAESPTTEPSPAGVAAFTMPAWSRYAGRPVDDNGRLSINAGGAGIADGATHATFDYFRHEGANWRAVVPLGGVQRVYGQTYNFSAPKTR
ncbi:MAG: hypothetical protein AAF596_09270, partial [Planctomycetota bacterium]